MNHVLNSQENHAILSGVIQVNREEAERLSRLYLALAQEYRRLAGLKPIPTNAQQRKLAVSANK